MKSMSYGQLPTKQDFMKAYKKELGTDGLYEMRLVGDDKQVAGRAVDLMMPNISNGLDLIASGAEGWIGGEELWRFIKMLVRLWDNGDDAAGDLASSILSTLDFEWF